MIFILIPVFNSIEHTKVCIASLEKQSCREYKIIIIDDGSSDGTMEYFSAKENIKIIRGNGEWWWTRSIHEGIHYIRQFWRENDFVLTLNNDLWVAPDYLERMITCSRDHSPCLTGSLSLDMNNPERILFCGLKWNSLTAAYSYPEQLSGNYSKLKKEKNAPLESDLLPGRGTLIPVRVLKEIGDFDYKHFPQYIADEEFSLRARKAGYKLIIPPDAVVYSDAQKTGLNFKYQKPEIGIFLKALFSLRSSLYLKSRFFFALKHGKIPPLYFLFDTGRIIISFIRQYIKYHIAGK